MRIHGVELTDEELKQWVKDFLERREREKRGKKYTEQAIKTLKKRWM